MITCARLCTIFDNLIYTPLVVSITPDRDHAKMGLFVMFIIAFLHGGMGRRDCLGSIYQDRVAQNSRNFALKNEFPMVVAKCKIEAGGLRLGVNLLLIWYVEWTGPAIRWIAAIAPPIKLNPEP
jgi:hypothetical protein